MSKEINMNEMIIKKRDGNKLSKEEIEDIIGSYNEGVIPDYQMSAFLMAIYYMGLDKEETFELTKAILNSGEKIDLSKIEGIKIDKHSTGGVGDKTTLIATPIAAAAGVPIAKMSGRGLGFTGGTVDKLSSIPDFKIELTSEDFISQVNKIGISIISQSGDITPADKKLYALRDVTGTVDSMSLIASSIMSKKLASGSDGIILDVKCGKGAFFKKEDDAIKASEMMIDIGESAGKKVAVVISSMDQPLGRAVGNTLEVMEALDVLKGVGDPDITEISLELAGIMIYMSGIADDLSEGREIASDVLYSGKALDKFRELVKAQGGNSQIIDDYSIFGIAKYSRSVEAEDIGYISLLDAETIGKASQLSGAGRVHKEDEIDFQSGIIIYKKLGEQVAEGDKVIEIFSNDEDKLNKAFEIAKNSFKITKEKVSVSAVIKKTIGV